MLRRFIYVTTRAHRLALWLALMLALSSFSVSAIAHPGHDHSAPSSDWPAHAPVDRTAGLGRFANPNNVAISSASETDTAGLAVAAGSGSAMNHRLACWMFADGTTGSSSNTAVNNVVSSVLANVNTVASNANWVYLKTSGVPSHSVGPFQNPNIPGDLDATYRVRLNPVEETGTKVTSFDKFGPIGVLVNGVAIYSPSDATYWDSSINDTSAPGSGPPANGTDWSTNALWRRADGLDLAGGHPSPFRVGGQLQSNPNGTNKGLYHYHKLPEGLSNEIDPTNNGTLGSPIYGYAFDGFPIVGPYAYEDDGSGNLSAVQMTSSYKLKDASSRPANGPSVTDFALGSFLEDFEYDAGSGTLNQYNMAFVKFDGDGRAIVTDQTDIFGEWAYFMTKDVVGGSPNDTTRDFEVAFPYIIGPEFFGEVDNVLILNNGTLTVPNNVSYLFEYLPGDYNTNGIVDAADYVTWRDAFGQPAGALLNDVDGGTIGMAQYDTWKANFGNVAPTLLAAAVPEPRALSLISCGFIALLLIRYRRRIPNN